MKNVTLNSPRRLNNMREAFPSLPFNSNVPEEKLTPSPLIDPSLSSVSKEELKKEEHEVPEQQYPAINQSFPSYTGSAVEPNSTSSREPELTIIITEKIIINREGETIKETLVDKDSEKHAIFDTDGPQSHIGNLPPTVISTASTTTASTATASSATLAVSTAAAVPSGPGVSGTTSSSTAAVTLSTTPSFGELEELQNILHFPEEVALRITDAEYQLFYQVTFYVLAF